jgi:AraC family transcriptional regulator
MTNSTTTKEYIARINRALDYIESNSDKQFTLDELANVANFSKFHFNRIFSACMGETPFKFIQRVRLEKAAFQLVTDHSKTVSEIAFKYGFSDISIFSRNFKTQFGVSATEYRRCKNHNSNNSQTSSNNPQIGSTVSSYFCPESKTIKWRTKMKTLKKVEVKELPKMTVAYLRHIGPYAGDEKLFEKLWNKLFNWAGPRGLIGGQGFNSLIIYHDDPNVTVEDKLRMSVCITVPPSTKVDGEIGKMELDAANYVIARFEVTAEGFAQAWQWVYGEWFPASGYQPDDKPCFEMYPEEPKNGIFVVDICVPVKPL